MAHATPPATRDGEPGTDVIFGALASARRRALLAYFERSAREEASLAELVDDLVASATDAGSRRRVETTLHHVHLPKLDAAGLVEYVPSEQQVHYRGHPLVPQSLQLVGELPSPD